MGKKCIIFLFQSSRNPSLAANTKLELPFWMVWALRGRGRAEPQLPKTWNATQRSIILADADVVDLVSRKSAKSLKRCHYCFFKGWHLDMFSLFLV